MQVCSAPSHVVRGTDSVATHSLYVMGADPGLAWLVVGARHLLLVDTQLCPAAYVLYMPTHNTYPKHLHKTHAGYNTQARLVRVTVCTATDEKGRSVRSAAWPCR